MIVNHAAAHSPSSVKTNDIFPATNIRLQCYGTGQSLSSGFLFSTPKCYFIPLTERVQMKCDLISRITQLFCKLQLWYICLYTLFLYCSCVRALFARRHFLWYSWYEKHDYHCKWSFMVIHLAVNFNEWHIEEWEINTYAPKYYLYFAVSPMTFRKHKSALSWW